MLGVQEQELHQITTHTCHLNNFLNTQNVTTCIPVLTPQGPIQHLKVLMRRFIQIECQSESTVPPTELEGSDTGQLGPSNSSGLLNRLCSHPTSVIPTSPNNSVTEQACTGDTGGSRTVNQGGNSGNYPLTSKFCLPDFPGREKGGGQRPVINLKALNQFV